MLLFTSFACHCHADLQTSIGRQLKQFLDMPESMKIGYSVFSEKLSAGSKAKDRYSI
jgi:translation initiation factor 4E